jgi:uncharacterized protein (DUF3820 family)
MSYKMPFGKYKGDTLAIIRMNDIGYVVWAAENIKQPEVKEQLDKAIAYINEVDPYALSGVQVRQQE